MGKTIVLGIGNRLMMDDGVGIYLVEELERLQFGKELNYLVGESDIDYCLEKIEGADFVLIVDAAFSGKKAGEVTVYPFAELHKHQKLEISPHNTHLFHVLVQQKIKGYLIGIEPYEIRFHIGMSPQLTELWEVVLQGVQQSILELVSRA